MALLKDLFPKVHRTVRLQRAILRTRDVIENATGAQSESPRMAQVNNPPKKAYDSLEAAARSQEIEQLLDAL